MSTKKDIKTDPFSDKFASGPPPTQNPNNVVSDPPPSYFPSNNNKAFAAATPNNKAFAAATPTNLGTPNAPTPDPRIAALTNQGAALDDPFHTPPIRIPKPPPDPRGPCAVSDLPRRSIDFDPAREPNLEFEPDRDYTYKPQHPRVFGAGDPRVDKGINADYETNLKPEYNAYYNSVRPHPNPYDDVPTAEAAQRLSIANEENTRDDHRPDLPVRPPPDDEHPTRKHSVKKHHHEKHHEKPKSRHEKIRDRLNRSNNHHNNRNSNNEKMERDGYNSPGRRTPRGGVWQKERRDWRTGEPIPYDDEVDPIYRHDLHDAGYQDGQPRRRGSRNRQGGCTDFALYFIGIFIPPIPVFMKLGWGCEVIINIVLWICGWILGVVHAWYIIYTNPGIALN